MSPEPAQPPDGAGPRRDGSGTGGPRVVEGRLGVRGLLALFAEALGLLRASRHLRLSFAFWTGLGLVLLEASTAALARGASAPVAALAAAALGWWLVVTVFVAGGAVLLRSPAGDRRYDFYGAPNGLTAVRAYACLPMLLCALLSLPGSLGLGLFAAVGFFAGMLDLVDGYIARRVGPLTELGRALDPAMDALFFPTGVWGSYALGIVPVWVMVLVVVRYLGPLLGTPLVFLARRRPELVHTVWGRRNTAAVGVVLFVCLWVRVAGGPVWIAALAVGLPLLVPTTLLHFVALAERAYHAPVVRPRRRDRT